MDRQEEESWAKSASLPAHELRQTVALHLLKWVALKGQGLPGDPQTDLVMAAFEEANLHGLIDPRTWQAWFGVSPQRIRPDSLAALDRYLGTVLSSEAGAPARGLQVSKGLLSEAVRGGLVARLLEKTNSKQPIHSLQARATDYEPLSPLHAHLDAIEVVALAEGNAGLPWEVVKRMGAMRLLEWIHERWNPRQGSVYATLSSDLKLRFDFASEEERLRIKASYARMHPTTLFERNMALPASPNWKVIGVPADIAPVHVFKLMMALVLDTEFLASDRFEAWLPDFVSAGLAMHALAWTDRYTTHGLRPAAESYLWGALSLLMFERCGRDRLIDVLQFAFDILELELTQEAFDTLVLARHSYWHTCGVLGVQRPTIKLYARRAEIIHPVVYGGGPVSPLPQRPSPLSS